MEKPKEGLKKSSKATKKQKVDGEEEPAEKKDDAPLTEAELAKRAEYVQKRKEKRQKKLEQQRKQKERAKEKKIKAKGVQPEAATGEANSTTDKPTNKPTNKPKKQVKKSRDVRSEQKPREQQIKDQPLTSTRQEEQSDVDEDDEDDDDGEEEEEDDGVAGGERDADLAKIDFSGLVDEVSDEDVEEDNREDEDDMQPITIEGMDVDDSDSASADGSETTPDHSPTFDGESSSSSTSSIVPPSQASISTTTKALKLATEESTTATTTDTTRPTKLPSPIDPALLQSRLQARIAALRAARKADGLNGNPARNRQELLEARRLKAETRKATKKELRAKTRLAQDAEAEAARLRGGSGSPLWSPAIMSPRVEEENSFSFGRIAFDDGARVDDKLGGLVDSKARRGTSDIKTRLDAVTRKKERLSGMDAEKRKEIEEKDRWLTARKKVQGEKVRDDANLLKKTLKRKEKLKDKSGKEWDGRIEGVRAGKEMRQKKRDENLRKRKEDKGSKGKKSGSKGSSKGGKKPAPKKRAGFEGTAKSGAKRS